MFPQKNPSPIVVLADDLSGAAELAGIAFAHGLTAEVQLRFESQSAAEVIALDSDTRGLSESSAAERVRRLAAETVASRPAWIYKKVDSVLRGNPRAEIEALLDVMRQRRAVLIPANPSRGRVVVSGQILIHGVPLDQTPFASDPAHPRRSASVEQLLGPLENAAHDIDVPGVASLADLGQQARALKSDTLAAGAADFFAALLEERCGPRPRPVAAARASLAAPALLVCGSRTHWPQRELQCRAANLPIINLGGCDSQSGPQAHGDAATRLLAHGVLVLTSGNASERANENRLCCIADTTKAILERARPATILAEGGATAAAIVAALGWQRFTVRGADSGVGFLQPLDVETAPRLLIKPGSYPWPTDIWQALCRLAH